MHIILSNESNNHWVENLPNEDYHSKKDFINQSTLKHILKSPRSFVAAYSAENKEPTEAMRFGTLVHKAILETDTFIKKYVVIPDFGDYRSSKNRDARDEWKLAQPDDSIFCTQDELDNLHGLTESLISNDEVMKLFKNARPELSGFYSDQNLKCRTRPDIISENGELIVEIKTAESCEMESFSKVIWKRRYDFQLASQCAGAKIINNVQVKYPIYLVIEKTPPFEHAIYVADETVMEIGTADYNRALYTLGECLKNNVWGRYQKTIQNISLPRYVVENNLIGGLDVGE